MIEDCRLIKHALQGWRLEIKAFPRLTEFGSRRGKEESQPPDSGFYSQSQACA